MTTVNPTNETSTVGVTPAGTTKAAGANQVDHLYQILDGFDGDIIEFLSIGKNAQSQKDKINSAISGEGLKAKRDQVAQTLKALKDELAKLDKEIAEAIENLQKAQEAHDKAI